MPPCISYATRCALFTSAMPTMTDISHARKDRHPPSGQGCGHKKTAVTHHRHSGFSDFDFSQLLLLEFEVDRECVPNLHGTAVHLAGDKFRQSLDNSLCFLVKVGVFATEHFNTTD